jgi:hypothetical protein
MSEATKPTRQLWFWVLFRLPDDKGFVVAGDNAATGLGQVSSRFVTFDAASLTGVTERGRPYELSRDDGNDGLHLQTAQTLAKWCGVNGYEYDDLTQTTPEEVEVALSARGPRP